MKRSRFSEEQIDCALRQVEGGAPPADICRRLGVSEATSYILKKECAHLGSASGAACASWRRRVPG